MKGTTINVKGTWGPMKSSFDVTGVINSLVLDVLVIDAPDGVYGVKLGDIHQSTPEISSLIRGAA